MVWNTRKQMLEAKVASLTAGEYEQCEADARRALEAIAEGGRVVKFRGRITHIRNGHLHESGMHAVAETEDHAVIDIGLPVGRRVYPDAKTYWRESGNSLAPLATLFGIGRKK